MATSEKRVEQRPAKETPGGDDGRKPYATPEVVHRAAFEAMAVACAPTPPAKGNPTVCPLGPISS